MLARSRKAKVEKNNFKNPKLKYRYMHEKQIPWLRYSDPTPQIMTIFVLVKVKKRVETNIYTKK